MRRVAALIALGGWIALPASGAGILAPATAEYLLVGLGPGSLGTNVSVSNHELGANNDVVPMSEIDGSVPPLPANALTVQVGQGGNGDVAITDPTGNHNMQDVDIFGDTGIDCAGSNIGNCTDGNSNSNYNGMTLNNSNGLNAGVDLSAVTTELTDARSAIPGFVGDHSLMLSFSDGKWAENENIVINLMSGTTVIDIDTNENDLSLVNSNLLFDGPAGAFAIVRIPDEANFVTNQTNIIVGDGGIGLNNVLFYTDKPDDNTHFNINDAIINGIAFWDLSGTGAPATWNNVQGCSQLVADRMSLQNVRLNRCAAAIPEPSTGLLVVVGLGVLATACGSTGRGRASCGQGTDAARG